MNLINPIFSCLSSDFVINPNIEKTAPRKKVKVKKVKYSKKLLNANDKIPFKITSPNPIPPRDIKNIKIKIKFPAKKERKSNFQYKITKITLYKKYINIMFTLISKLISSSFVKIRRNNNSNRKKYILSL